MSYNVAIRISTSNYTIKDPQLAIYNSYSNLYKMYFKLSYIIKHIAIYSRLLRPYRKIPVFLIYSELYYPLKRSKIQPIYTLYITTKNRLQLFPPPGNTSLTINFQRSLNHYLILLLNLITLTQCTKLTSSLLSHSSIPYPE